MSNRPASRRFSALGLTFVPMSFAATHARLAIASAGAQNDYGHPAPRTVQLVESLGMTMLRTDQNGSVAIRLGTDRLAAVTQR